MSAAFIKFSSFYKTLRTASKHLRLDGGDSSDWKAHATTKSTSSAAATSFSDVLRCKYNIEWEDPVGSKGTRSSGHDSFDDLDSAGTRTLCGMKTRFCCLGWFEEDKPKEEITLVNVHLCDTHSCLPRVTVHVSLSPVSLTCLHRTNFIRLTLI